MVTLTPGGCNCEHASDDAAIVELARSAVADGRLRTAAQPIVRVATGDVSSEELLVRLATEDGRILLPDTFVPAAERHGLMPKIDRFVIGRAAELAASGHSVHVNLSATTLSDPALFGDILAAVNAHRAEPTRMVFEITETAAASNMDCAASVADRLRAFGFRIALDDFGSGWGSFKYLSALPIDMLKIDRTFVRDVGTTTRATQLLRGVVSLADTLGVTTVGEGVEDERTLTSLRALGIDYAQGTYIGRPQPVESPRPRRGARALQLAS